MPIPRILLLTIITAPVLGQWLSFDLSAANKNIFLKQVEPIVRSSVLSFGHPTRMNLSESKRVGLAVSFPLGWDIPHESLQTNPHLFSLFVEGQLLASDNLVLKGRMNLISPKNESMNMAGYGLEYYKDTWSASIGIGWLEGTADMKIKMIDFNLLSEKTIFEVPFDIGVGINNYKVRFNNINDKKIPTRLENSLVYIMVGTRYHFQMFDINIQTQFTSTFLQFNFQMLKSFF